ncbi:polyubiquitin-tagged protein recognition complex, Npl4 component [Gonapodya prolifera JEL478]|uniref:Nuclear protein localization protein 4 n=1 Tax=Gonapodya prolifera (strain JEL478) TaxID=1344416 RepID=A0A139AAF5_GONPJ|nr:polyubiquitin-tagged protein recognition complex, Npl4 component [Gonapodya prolifera JEL478]|eukprot:KXS13669.1 polyubiquitin-tagged protein recognition complex, Npl4 component [Gonapodya prolifera JEL478]
MIIRVRGPEGQARIDVDQSEDAAKFLDKVASQLKLSPGSFRLALEPTGEKPLILTGGKTVGKAGLKHGDQIFAIYDRNIAPVSDSDAAGKATSSSTSPTQLNGVPGASVSSSMNAQSSVTSATGIDLSKVVPDPVDVQLEKSEGLIKRARDPRFCRHGDLGMCDYCRPLEPFDSRYLEQNKIKHMSFHAHLRQIASLNRVSSATFVPPLDEPDYRVKNPCPSGNHPPYPDGICSKCQPSALTLHPQTFRMVDHVEFESASIVDNFIRYWRSTGVQRFGYLYGRYEPYAEVALGVKAVVAAIYEPPQEAAADGIQLRLPDVAEARVEAVAAKLGLRRVGVIFTDLLDDGTGKGTVVCKRHSESYFLSSAEAVFAAQVQLEHPTPTRYSTTGKFGSRMVTCVISGDENGGITLFTYQVSNTAMAMVRDDIIEPSVEPAVMLVKESTEKQYIPEVFYKYKNKYNILVQEAAKPSFPVEYLLVTLTDGFPQNPSPTFVSLSPFPVEHREDVDPQDISIAKKSIANGKLSQAISDFHFLVFLAGMGILSEDDFAAACTAARSHSDADASELAQRSSWRTLVTVLNTASSSATPATSSGGAGAGHRPTGSSAGGSTHASWSCRHCTFENRAGSVECEMCGLPRD